MYIQYWHQSRSSCARTFRQSCLRQINDRKCINCFLSTKPLHLETLWRDCACINSINAAASQQVNPICFSTSGHAYSLRYTNGKLFMCCTLLMTTYSANFGPALWHALGALRTRVVRNTFAVKRQRKDMAGESDLLYRMKLTTHVTRISYDVSQNRNSSSIPNLTNICINTSVLKPIPSTAHRIVNNVYMVKYMLETVQRSRHSSVSLFTELFIQAIAFF
jgi:hypothetical protein